MVEGSQKKRQHYVPRFYLSRFAADNHSTFVFDKFTGRVFQTNITNIANEKYFYDFPKAEAKEYGIDVQLVENALADMEQGFAEGIEGLLGNIETNQRSKLIRPSDMELLSRYIAVQSLRTREHRRSLGQLSVKLSEALIDRLPDTKLNEYEVELNEDYISLLQSASLFGPELELFASVLREHIWLIGLNHTVRPFYTSDHPVVRRAHKIDPHGLTSYGGFASEGIEIALPLSPQYILILCERSFHQCVLARHCGCMVLDNEEYVKYYNGLQVAQSYRQVYCLSDDFGLAREVCKAHPELCDPDRSRVCVD